MSRSSDSTPLPPPGPGGAATARPGVSDGLDDWDSLFDPGAAEPSAPPIALELEEGQEVEPEAPLSERYLGFRLGSEYYAVPVLKLSEVVLSREICPVPRVKPFVRGVFSVRGTIVPVVDLRRRLDFDSGAGTPGAVAPEATFGGGAADTDRERVLITRMGGETFGLLVDEVTHPFSIEADEVEPPPPSLPRRLVEFVEGIGRVDERIHILLDLDVVLRFDAVAEGRGRKEGPR
jgi:purine-binding chemotaxis protein CheW